MASHAIDVGDNIVDSSPIVEYGMGRGLMITIACFVATLSGALIYDVLPPIMGDLAQHFGGGAHGTFVAQLAGTLPLFGVMVAALSAGWLIERVGLRPALLSGMALFGVAGSAGVLIDNVGGFLLARFLMGAGVGIMMTACNAVIALYFHGRPRARMNGFIIGSGAVGGIVFVLIAGLTAAWWWRAPFLLHGAVILFFLIPVLASGSMPNAAPSSVGAIGNLRRLRPILPVCLVGFAWYVMMLMSGVKTPFVMAQSGITNHSTIGMIYAINAGSVSLASFLFGSFVPRYSAVRVIRMCFMLAAVGLCVIATAHGIPQFMAGLACNGISVGIALTALWTWAMQQAPRYLIARSLGAMTTSLYLGGAMMPILTAPYEHLFGIRGQFFAMAGTIVVVVLLLWITQRGRTTDASAASAA